MKKLTKDKVELEDYLKSQTWLKPGEEISKMEVPGEGNMNFTLRIDTGERTFILKQSRSFVEKYPQVSAPVERVLSEARFYDIVAGNATLNAMTPNVLGLDKANSVMLINDLGVSSDFSRIFRKGESIDQSDLEILIDFAAELHTSFPVEEINKPIRNTEMRFLNYEHMFVIPYLENNGISLNGVLPGLSKVAEDFKADKALRKAAEIIGERYINDGAVLLHGDYYPGSWLKTSDGIRIIDPEFCFFGDPEFDVGVMCAHLKMADQPAEMIEIVLNRYSAKANLDKNLAAKYSAVEILRRMLGLAQLPLEIDLQKRKSLMEEAREVLLKN